MEANDNKEKRVEIRTPKPASKTVFEMKSELERLRESDREWKFMFNMLAHDLKEPIVTLEGFTKFLSETSPLSAEQQRYLKVLREAVDGLHFMIDSLQSIPKLYQKPRKIVSIKLNQLIGSVANSLSEKMQKTGGQVVLPKEDLMIQSDPLPLYHIFLNLFTNSLKFHRKEETPVIRVNYEETESGYMVSIADNGVGIDAKDLERIFTPFARVDEAVTDGLGLGLSIIKRIVESLGGKVSVESIKNEGTVFRLHLPQKPESFNNDEQKRPS